MVTATVSRDPRHHVKLSPSELKRIDEAFPADSAAGARYPAQIMTLVEK
jgi:hypothetical protein